MYFVIFILVFILVIYLKNGSSYISDKNENQKKNLNKENAFSSSLEFKDSAEKKDIERLLQISKIILERYYRYIKEFKYIEKLEGNKKEDEIKKLYTESSDVLPTILVNKPNYLNYKNRFNQLKNIDDFYDDLKNEEDITLSYFPSKDHVSELDADNKDSDFHKKAMIKIRRYSYFNQIKIFLNKNQELKTVFIKELKSSNREYLSVFFNDSNIKSEDELNSNFISNEIDNRVEKIKSIISFRNIKYLIHFTRVENLPNILKNGLQGRDYLNESNVNFEYNDEYRLDRLNNSICTTVSFPNYKMFFKIKKENPGKDWAIIKIDPSILWRKKAVFCKHNAASNKVTSIPVKDRMTIKSFQDMFGDAHMERDDFGVPDYYTTDPQAEILFLENIESDFIMEICFNSDLKINNKDYINSIISEYSNSFVFKKDNSLFKPRSDYEYWSNSFIKNKETSTLDDLDIPF